MLNKGADGKLMVYEPAFLTVKTGDMVKFLATTKGYSAESVDGKLPAGAKPFRGWAKSNERVARAGALTARAACSGFGLDRIRLVRRGRSG
ncbi:MAG: hypothetical protein AVDCRST_MAG91-450 [uncultured Sphingomonadaceae bacterium]|uniref:Uncharacterized protein n=1 Tax=uncultured Sphingomonadaceae bacterium TaxID=169976 RepID=A0A6J4S8V9_9SPHN|nr:MAG: hypothetical protein AVDCRST_MAG91-450 [uncultured Sphingomonadaceae bacterium]